MKLMVTNQVNFAASIAIRASPGVPIFFAIKWFMESIEDFHVKTATKFSLIQATYKDIYAQTMLEQDAMHVQSVEKHLPQALVSSNIHISIAV